MTTLHELEQMPLHEMTLRVLTADTHEERMHEFGDWLLRVVGIDGAHGVDAVNEVIHEEFGSGVTLTPEQLTALQHYYGPRYHIRKNGEIYLSAA